MFVKIAISVACILSVQTGCIPQAPDSHCGPSTGVVSRVIDGDTIELTSGERVRYLMVDTPESVGGKTDCFGVDAKSYNRALVEGQEVALEYDNVCTDTYGRLLAYVYVDDVEVNTELVDQGYACLLHIPPNGEDRYDEFLSRQAKARSEGKGMWGACEVVTCD